jgi:hypothetical protein
MLLLAILHAQELLLVQTIQKKLQIKYKKIESV